MRRRCDGRRMISRDIQSEPQVEDQNVSSSSSKALQDVGELSTTHPFWRPCMGLGLRSSNGPERDRYGVAVSIRRSVRAMEPGPRRAKRSHG